MKIFLVDDSLRVRAQLVRAIEDMPGAQVVGEAECEELAIALIKHTRPELVLLDLQLAFGGSGLNVLRRLRAEGFTGRVFVMTNQVLDAYRLAAMHSGADRFYDKTVELPRLMNDIAQLALRPEREFLQAA